MDLDKMPSEVRDALRERRFTDEQIVKMSAEDAFDETCMWYGLIGWGPKLRRWMRELKEAAVTR